MNWIVHHIASGHAFFTGVVLLILSALASIPPKPALNRASVLLFLVGVIVVVLSSTAISYWIYALAVAFTLGWFTSRFKKNWQPTTAYLVATIWVVAALLEAPFHFTPTPNPTLNRQVTVIGDSVTAGMGGNDASETWPSIIAREHQLEIQNLSHVGETIASALSRVKSNPISSPLVVIEIGGNDLLGTTGSKQFEKNLDALLDHLSADDRQLIMFELPLPPFCHEHGRAQRQLSAKHNVQLIPKRVFLSVIADGDTTLDSIHLSPSGHQRMADVVWSLIRPAFTDP